MPSSSIRLTRLASAKRGGGWVKCWAASTPFFTGLSPLRINGSRPSASSSSLASKPSSYTARKPANFTTCPVARKACRPVGSRSVTVVRSRLAAAIWLAIARLKIRSYSLPSSPLPARSRVKSVGRIASCASCAFLALVWYWRGFSGR